MNADAFQDLLEARGTNRSKVADDAEIALSTLSGLTKTRSGSLRVGASRSVAHRIAAALGCRPGTLFPDLAGKASATEQGAP